MIVLEKRQHFTLPENALEQLILAKAPRSVCAFVREAVQHGMKLQFIKMFGDEFAELHAYDGTDVGFYEILPIADLGEIWRPV